MITPRGREKLDELRIQQGLDPDLPWGGRSARVLTRGHLMGKLVQRAPSLTRFWARQTVKEFRRILSGEGF